MPFKKEVLAELFVIEHQVSKYLKSNNDKIIKNVIENYFINNRSSKNFYDKEYDYYQIQDDQTLFWLKDYIVDHYHFLTKEDLFKTEISALLQKTDQSISLHNHLNLNNLKDSPEVSVIYCLQEGGEHETNVVFEYDKDSEKSLKRWVPLKKGKLIIFNSCLNHRITTNLNDDPVVNLSLKFKKY